MSTDARKQFMEIVKNKMENLGMDQEQATLAVRREYPKIFKAMIEQANPPKKVYKPEPLNIYLTEDLKKQAKLTAVECNTSVSEMVRVGLEAEINKRRQAFALRGLNGDTFCSGGRTPLGSLVEVPKSRHYDEIK